MDEQAGNGVKKETGQRLGSNPMGADPIKDAMSANPEVADRIAADMLKDQRRHERDEFIGTVVGPRNKFDFLTGKYEFDIFERLGLPFYTVLAVGVALHVAMSWLGLPSTFLLLFDAAVVLLVVVVAIRRYFK